MEDLEKTVSGRIMEIKPKVFVIYIPKYNHCEHGNQEVVATKSRVFQASTPLLPQ